MCTVQISLEQVKQRIYVAGNTYAIKDRLKAAGCKWDGDRKQWWIGVAKRADIEAIVSGLHGKEAPKQDLDTCNVYGKVEYTGKSGKPRTYYVIGQTSTGRLRLTVLDGSMDFWADAAACKWVKRYEARPAPFRGYGNRQNGQPEYQTLGQIRRFIDRQRNPETRRGQCSECGAWGPAGEACNECGGEGSYC